MYFWKILSDYPSELIGEYDRDESPDRFDLLKGEKVVDSWGIPKLVFNASKSELEVFDDLANNAMIPLVSPKLAKLLETEFTDGIQLIESEVVCNEGILEGYKLVNVVNIENFIDKEKSTYLSIPGTEQPMSFSKIVLKDEIPQCQIARESIYPSFLMVGESFKVLCEQNNLLGIGLYND